MKISLIILAAGLGSRMELGYNKMLHEVAGCTILEKTLQAFVGIDLISEIIVVVNENEKQAIGELLEDYNVKYVSGGKERYDSVYNGLQEVSGEYVLIHDGARCFIERKQIMDIIDATIKYDAATLAVLAKDTIHIVDDEGFIVSTPNRSMVYLAQTPQGFKTDLIKNVYDTLYPNDMFFAHISDDATLVNEITNFNVKVIDSSYSNYKVTTIEDLKND